MIKLNKVVHRTAQHLAKAAEAIELRQIRKWTCRLLEPTNIPVLLGWRQASISGRIVSIARSGID